MPRHSPCALFSLTSSEETLYHSLPPSSSRLPSKAHSFRSSSSPIKTRFAGLLFGLVVFLPTSIRRKIHLWFLYFIRIMQAHKEVFLLAEIVSITLKFFFPYCCLLITFFILCSVFKVHLRRSKRRSFRFRPYLRFGRKLHVTLLLLLSDQNPLRWAFDRFELEGSLKSPIGDFNQPSREGIIFKLVCEKRCTL